MPAFNAVQGLESERIVQIIRVTNPKCETTEAEFRTFCEPID